MFQKPRDTNTEPQGETTVILISPDPGPPHSSTRVPGPGTPGPGARLTSPVQLWVRTARHLRTRDAELRTRDAELSTRDAELSTLDAELRTRDAELRTRDAELRTQDAELRTRDAAEHRENRRRSVC